jgi:hypothetical protein
MEYYVLKHKKSKKYIGFHFERELNEVNHLFMARFYSTTEYTLEHLQLILKVFRIKSKVTIEKVTIFTEKVKL